MLGSALISVLALACLIQVAAGVIPPANLRERDLYFTAQPQNQTITISQSATFTVTVIGASPLRYQWTFNGANVGSNSNTYTRTNCNLADDGGRVQVTVSNIIGSTQSRPAILSVGPLGTSYFVATNGSSGNTGLSHLSPWSLTYGISKLGSGITLTLMPGVYYVSSAVSIYNVKGTALNPATVRSQYKWQAVIANSTNRGIEVWNCSYVVLDGLCVSNSYSAGIKIMDSYETVRNCWLTHNGNAAVVTSLDASGPGNGNALIEYNLVENGGATPINGSHGGHGIYIGGSNNIVRGNVVRNNGGFGIHMYMEDGRLVPNNNQIYNNLTYGHTNFYGVALYGADGLTGQRPGTNYFFGNTILDGMQVVYGSVRMTNNIILPSPVYSHPIYFSDTHVPLVWADYNLSTLPITNVAVNAIGSHDIITNDAGFVNVKNGLYWLSAASPARNKANAEIVGPVDFFGNLPTSVSDLGAFQYTAALGGDLRVLDPAPANPDYWSLP